VSYSSSVISSRRDDVNFGAWRMKRGLREKEEIIKVSHFSQFCKKMSQNCG